MKHYNGYGAYLLFLALRTHFTTKKYDFIRMHGKLNATKQSYETRRDKQFFERLAKRYGDSELKDFYISNILVDKHYVTDLLTEEANSTYLDYVRRRQMLTYNFKNEVESIFEKGIAPVFRTKSDQYPPLIIEYLNNTISPETMVVLDKFFRYSGKFNQRYSGDIIWSKISLKIEKYASFVNYDKQKIIAVLKEVTNEHI